MSEYTWNNLVKEEDIQNLAKLLGNIPSLKCSSNEYGKSKGVQGKVDIVFDEAIKVGLSK